MRATIIAALYGICATALLTFYSVYDWLEPHTPLVIGALAVVIPSFIIVMALEDEARPPNLNVMLLVQTGLIAGIFGLALPALWVVPSIRAKALSALPSMRSVEEAMGDSDPGVSAGACQMLFEPRLKYRIDQATAVLYDRPQVAPVCIDGAPDGELVAGVAKQLAITWHEALMAGGENECPKAAALDGLPLAPASKVGMLLDCSLKSMDGSTRECCADQLAAAYPGPKLLREITAGQDVVKGFGTSAFLLAAAFDEKIFVKEIAPVHTKLGLQTDAFREVSLQLACSAVTSEQGHTDDLNYLRWLFDHHTSCLPDDVVGEVDVVGACNEFMTYPASMRKDFGTALCKANLSVRVRQAESIAARRASRDLGDFAREIDLGRSHLQGEQLAPENFAQLAENGEFESMSEEDRARFIASVQDRTVADPINMSPEEIARKAMAVSSKDGREKATEDYLNSQSDGDLQKAMGLTVQDLQAAMGEDGELSDEMKEKIAEKRAKAEKPQ